jgi:hypothetical protein
VAPLGRLDRRVDLARPGGRRSRRRRFNNSYFGPLKGLLRGGRGALAVSFVQAAPDFAADEPANRDAGDSADDGARGTADFISEETADSAPQRATTQLAGSLTRASGFTPGDGQTTGHHRNPKGHTRHPAALRVPKKQPKIYIKLANGVPPVNSCGMGQAMASWSADGASVVSIGLMGCSIQHLSFDILQAIRPTKK